MRTPAEDAARLAGELAALVKRLRDAEDGAALFTFEDVNRIVGERLAREKRRTRREAARADDAEAELEELRQRPE